MDTDGEASFTEAVAQSLRDGYAAEFDRMDAELGAVAVSLGVQIVPHCRVFWGSHGCAHPRGHAPEIPHACDCCECKDPGCKPSCVAKPPYYGLDTRFYGEDAAALGLPLVG